MRPSIFGCTPWTLADPINDHVKPIPIPCTHLRRLHRGPSSSFLHSGGYCCSITAMASSSSSSFKSILLQELPPNRGALLHCLCTSFISLPGHSSLPLDSFYCCLSCNWKLYFDNLIIGYARFDPLCTPERHFWKALSTASTAGGLPGILRPRTVRGWCTQICYHSLSMMVGREQICAFIGFCCA